MLISALSACPSKNNSSDATPNVSNSETDIQEETISDKIDRDFTLSPYVVIGVDVQIVLRTDGTVIARGLNPHGDYNENHN